MTIRTTGPMKPRFRALLQTFSVAAFALALPSLSHAGEHGGTAAEHGGKAAEHGGKAAEHGGKKAEGFTAEQIKAAMNAHIETQVREGKGHLVIKDDKSGETLKLKFVKIHDPVRKIEGKGYFACTDFQPEGAPEGKLYDLDFWLNPEGENLAVTETRIHKHPKKKGKKWTKEARYTFVNDKPVEVK